MITKSFSSYFLSSSCLSQNSNDNYYYKATTLSRSRKVQNQFTKNHKGSGLGLAIARSLTELHGGAIQIRSTVGVGTTVSIRLPHHPDSDENNQDVAAA